MKKRSQPIGFPPDGMVALANRTLLDGLLRRITLVRSDFTQAMAEPGIGKRDRLGHLFQRAWPSRATALVTKLADAMIPTPQMRS